MSTPYVHGYNPRESIRLLDQAVTLTQFLHSGTVYAAESRVLEVGCGVGAQTVPLAQKSPQAIFTSIDVSDVSIQEARQKAEAAGLTNVNFLQADIFKLPDEIGTFDHIFVCFVLEHLADPARVLKVLKRHLNSGGSITVIEGDHGSTFFYPKSEAVQKAIESQVELQKQSGGNALIGRELYPLLLDAGYTKIHVSPKVIYVDSSMPELAEGFTKNTFTVMIEGIRDSVIRGGLIDAAVFDQGIKDLYRTSELDGVFCYTFFKAVGEV